ncbi:helix-turn-helix domain-containing protein [Aquimarina rhabdastrellae]
MSLELIKTYHFKEQDQATFSLSLVSFDEACIINAPEQVDAFKIYWIKEGRGTYTIDFKTYSFEGEVLFFLTPGQVFSITSEAIKEACRLSFIPDFYCIATHDKEISCNGILFNNTYETPFVKPQQRVSNQLRRVLENIIDEFEHPDTAQYDLLQSFLKQFIILSVRAKKEGTMLLDEEESLVFKNFSVLVEQNYKKMHSVSAYAERLGITSKSLTKHLQRIGTSSPSTIIKERIILESKRALIYTDKNIKEIAYDLGYEDPAYFSRFFTKAVGKSPLNFKSEYKSS